MNDQVIYEVKFFDKVIESKKGIEYAKTCAKKLNIPESERDAAYVSNVEKNYITMARNN